MTTYKFGDVVLVPFPFTDQTATKKRPAVVVSSDDYHADHINLILMGISSQLSPTLRAGEAIIKEWKKAGLIGPSAVKPVLTTIEKRLVIHKLGKLSQTDVKAVEQALKSILG
jgi:mRNA interferase MazF